VEFIIYAWTAEKAELNNGMISLMNFAIYRHEGGKKTMPATWTDYLEWQSNYFTYHFCIPTFMLRNINLSYIQSHAIENGLGFLV
jgi:hypothetical protein